MDLLSDEEVAEREALQERDELADKGFYSEPESDAIPPECERCGAHSLCASAISVRTKRCGQEPPKSVTAGFAMTVIGPSGMSTSPTWIKSLTRCKRTSSLPVVMRGSSNE